MEGLLVIYSTIVNNVFSQTTLRFLYSIDCLGYFLFEMGVGSIYSLAHICLINHILSIIISSEFVIQLDSCQKNYLK